MALKKLIKKATKKATKKAVVPKEKPFKNIYTGKTLPKNVKDLILKRSKAKRKTQRDFMIKKAISEKQKKKLNRKEILYDLSLNLVRVLDGTQIKGSTGKASKRTPGYDAKLAEKQSAKVKRVRDANAKAFKVFNGFEREGKIVPGELEALKQRFNKAGGASELGMSFTNFKNMYKGPYYLGTKYSVSGKKK